jgi:hypothetical protein
MSKYTDEEWEEIGRKWREAAKMDGAVPFDALAFVRWLKHAGHIKDYIRVPDDGLPFAEGKYDPIVKSSSIAKASGVPQSEATRMPRGPLFTNVAMHSASTGTCGTAPLYLIEISFLLRRIRMNSRPTD